jgi:hypothetical protein
MIIRMSVVVTHQTLFWVVIRHNLGENYSYFWNKMFLQFFALLQDSDVITEYDETTISVQLEGQKQLLQ